MEWMSRERSEVKKRWGRGSKREEEESNWKEKKRKDKRQQQEKNSEHAWFKNRTRSNQVCFSVTSHLHYIHLWFVCANQWPLHLFLCFNNTNVEGTMARESASFLLFLFLSFFSKGVVSFKSRSEMQAKKKKVAFIAIARGTFSFTCMCMCVFGPGVKYKSM